MYIHCTKYIIEISLLWVFLKAEENARSKIIKFKSYIVWQQWTSLGVSYLKAAAVSFPSFSSSNFLVESAHYGSIMTNLMGSRGKELKDLKSYVYIGTKTQPNPMDVICLMPFMYGYCLKTTTNTYLWWTNVLQKRNAFQCTPNLICNFNIHLEEQIVALKVMNIEHPITIMTVIIKPLTLLYFLLVL